jgi:hypothetical protein
MLRQISHGAPPIKQFLKITLAMNSQALLMMQTPIPTTTFARHVPQTSNLIKTC